MSEDEIYKKLNKLFQEVFNDETIMLSEATSVDDVEDWDSLGNVNLLVEIEKSFSIKLQKSEFLSIENVGEMVDIIMERMK